MFGKKNNKVNYTFGLKVLLPWKIHIKEKILMNTCIHHQIVLHGYSMSSGNVVMPGDAIET